MVLLELEIEAQRKALEPTRLEREKARAEITKQNQRTDDIEVRDMGLATVLPPWLMVPYCAATCRASRQDSEASRGGQGSLGQKTSTNLCTDSRLR